MNLSKLQTQVVDLKVLVFIPYVKPLSLTIHNYNSWKVSSWLGKINSFQNYEFLQTNDKSINVKKC